VSGHHGRFLASSLPDYIALVGHVPLKWTRVVNAVAPVSAPGLRGVNAKVDAIHKSKFLPAEDDAGPIRQLAVMPFIFWKMPNKALERSRGISKI
jgi:hypothetical protein